MDYLDAVTIERHVSWRTFRLAFAAGGLLAGRRLVLATTTGATRHADFRFPS